MDQRFVVEVTERVDSDDLDEVARQVGERLQQSPERFAVLLDDRIGPVTQPLARAPAEQVADALRAAGVRVIVGEVSSRGTLPATRWLPSPHDTYERDMRGALQARDAIGSHRMGESEDIEEPDSARVGGPGSVVSVREGWNDPDPPGQSDAASAPWSERGLSETRSRFRRLLLFALVLSLVVLLALQLGFSLRGTPTGGYDLGLAHYRQGRFVAARRSWLPAADGGDPRAQFMVGYLSEMGLGQPWSNAGAAPWYRQAAERGHPQAQARLASLYARGMGVPHDEETAGRWYREAALGGLLEAQYELGLRHLHGRGVDRDPDAARLWFERAAAAGHAEAATLAALLSR